MDEKKLTVELNRAELKESTKFFLSRMRPAAYYNFACACCGKTIQKGELLIECPDCGAIFCKECVESESYESHHCEDYDYDDDCDCVIA